MSDPRDGCPDCGDIDHHGCGRNTGDCTRIVTKSVLTQYPQPLTPDEIEEQREALARYPENWSRRTRRWLATVDAERARADRAEQKLAEVTDAAENVVVWHRHHAGVVASTHPVSLLRAALLDAPTTEEGDSDAETPGPLAGRPAGQPADRPVTTTGTPCPTCDGTGEVLAFGSTYGPCPDCQEEA